MEWNGLAAHKTLNNSDQSMALISSAGRMLKFRASALYNIAESSISHQRRQAYGIFAVNGVNVRSNTFTFTFNNSGPSSRYSLQCWQNLSRLFSQPLPNTPGLRWSPFGGVDQDFPRLLEVAALFLVNDSSRRAC